MKLESVCMLSENKLLRESQVPYEHISTWNLMENKFLKSNPTHPKLIFT